MHRVYSNRLPGQRRIHIEITPTEIVDLLADLGEEGPYDHPATNTLVDLLTAAHALFVEDEDDAHDAARQASGRAARTTTHKPGQYCGRLIAGDTPGTWSDCNLRDGHDGLHGRQDSGQAGTTAAPGRSVQARARLAAFLGYEPNEHDALFESRLDAYRAAVLNEAADAIEQDAGDMTRFRGSQIADELRRMAEQAAR